MFSAKSVCFYLSLIFVAVPHVLSSTGVNKTAGNGKVFITGDHNEVVVSTARETKIELDEIKSKLQSLSKKTEKLSVQVQAMAQSLTTLEKEGADYGLLFPRKGTNDYVITRGMPSLTAVTMCFWMKTADKGNRGVPLSYATSKDHNELAIWDYRKFQIFVGGTR
ncbi:uncharacterized protein LOC144640838, partial [Oculina patagonica]